VFFQAGEKKENFFCFFAAAGYTVLRRKKQAEKVKSSPSFLNRL